MRVCGCVHLLYIYTYNSTLYNIYSDEEHIPKVSYLCDLAV